MRHRLKGRKLNRTKEHRRALFSNLTAALILHEQIKTTLPKAKDLRSVIEKLITKAKKDTVANRRYAFSFLRNKELVKKLFEVLGKRYLKRPGGYTRVLKAGFRFGDSAPMAFIELVDRDPNAKGSVLNFVDDSSESSKSSKEDKKAEKSDAKKTDSKKTVSKKAEKSDESDKEESKSK